MSGIVETSEIEALLRELESVGGSPTYESSNNNNNNSINTVDNNNNGEDNRPFSQRRRGSGNVDLVVSRFTKRTGRSLFSTYADTNNNNNNNNNNESRRAVVPLGKRLPPLKPIGANMGDLNKESTQRAPTLFRAKVIGGSSNASSQQQQQRPPLEEAREILGTGRKLSLESQQEDQQQEKGGEIQIHRRRGSKSSDEKSEDYREANFLPIMCARYMNPAGITPRARWGHTMTPMQGHKLLLFGGMDIDEGETNSLFEYDAHHVSWDPVFVDNTVLPTPRTNHAACSREGRWLYISGGSTHRGGRILGDLYCYDTYKQEWKCIWEYNSSSISNKNEPTPRFGHSMIFRDDRLYIFGGKTLKRDQSEARGAPIVTVASCEVYVFSLNSHKWKRRIHIGKGTVSGEEKKTPEKTRKRTQSTESAEVGEDETGTNGIKTVPERPSNRYYHATCVLGDKMYINGGVSDTGVTLSDTWMLDLKEQKWIQLHDGTSADAFPRERHHLFACGEALMVVGGCSASAHSGRITLKYHNFVAVLPLESDVTTPCWIPVAMGNVAIVSPSKKAFGAAFSGGFVHVFGGVCGSEPATNTMVRFLAADGYFEIDSRATTAASADALRSMMRHLREGGSGAAYDVYVLPRSFDGENTIDIQNIRSFGVHRALLQQRAPKFWEDLTRCRTQQVRTVSGRGKDTAVVLEEMHIKDESTTTTTVALTNDGLSGNNNNNNNKNKNNNGGNGDVRYNTHAIAYCTEGNSRVQGLSLPLSSEQLQCLLDYIYWGDIHHRVPWEQDEDEMGDEGNIQEEINMIEGLRRAAELYKLIPLFDICDALISRNRKKLKHAQESSMKQLQGDLLSLLESSNGATSTVLFVDPHTKQQSVHALHPFILMASNSFFNDLLRPLLSGERSSFQVGPVAAKLKSGGRGSITSTTGNSNSNSNSNNSSTQTRRDILIGPVSVPHLAVQPLLRYFYTQQLTVPREAVFATMLGAHLLDVPSLQAYCESVLAREEVNYDTAAEFYALAVKYEAPLLQETALLTAVLGYAMVRHSAAYRRLAEKEAREIDAVALELGATTWIAPPQATSEVKPAAVYQARWYASAPPAR